MAEDAPELLYEERLYVPEPMGVITRGDGEKFFVLARLAVGPNKTILVDLGVRFSKALQDYPGGVASTADELAAILRDAIMRAGVAGVVA